MSSSQNKHLSDRLIRTIESNAEELTEGTVKKLQSSPRTETYHKVSHNDLHNRCYEIYHQPRHVGVGEVRSSHSIPLQRTRRETFREGIPLKQVSWALVLTKERLLEYLGECGLGDSAMELYQQQEFVSLISHFFDRALCYAAEGYERHASEKKAAEGHGELGHSRTFWPNRRSAQKVSS